MRRHIGTAIAVSVVALALVSCTSTTHGHGTFPTTHIPTGTGTLATPNARCVQLASASSKIAAAQLALYTGDKGALTDLDAALATVRAGAPAAVQSAVDRLTTGFHSASALLANPTAANKQKLAQLAPQLAQDDVTVSSYATSTCGH